MAERSFKSEVAKLRLGAGEEFRGEGILAVTKALLQSGVSYVSGYQGAPISHLVDVLADADDVLRDLGIRFEASVNEAAAAAALAASINYPLRGGGGGFVGARLETDAEIAQHVVGIGEHVDKVGDRRALVAGDVGHAGLQQRLGDGENAFAAEFLPGAEPKLRDLAFERAFCHPRPFASSAASPSMWPAIDSTPRHRDYI